LGLEPAGGIYQDDVDSARLRGCQAVENDRRRIGPLAAPDEFGAAALRPYLELLGRGGAKRVGRDQQNALALRSQKGGELSDRRRLPAAVHADHQDDGRFRAERELVGQRQKIGQVLFETRDDLIGRPPFFLPDDDLEAVDDLLGRLDSEIRREQYLFELIPKIAVDRPARLRQGVDRAHPVAEEPETRTQLRKPAHPSSASCGSLRASTRYTQASTSATTT